MELFLFLELLASVPEEQKEKIINEEWEHQSRLIQALARDKKESQ